MTHDERFQRLTVLLAAWQPLWRPLPFHDVEPTWAAAYPALVRALLALNDVDLARFHDDPFIDVHAGRHPLADDLPVAELKVLCEVPALAGAEGTLPQEWGEHVGGRKWRQIEAFVPHVLPESDQALVEWCAGKGHLSRALSRQHGVPVTALEWQAALCEDGQRLAERQDVAVDLCEQDVMASATARWLDETTHVVALHACGDLHVHLLQLAAMRGSAVTLAPCCYQRTQHECYRPLSRAGHELARRHALSLRREELSLAVQETVTAPRHVRRHRRRASAWRLGFDMLQREVRGIDEYLTVPSLAYGRMPESFAGFCRWAAERKGLSLPDRVDWVALEAQGWQRQADVERLELVRQLFRRPLELWLVLDRVAMLEEAGFEVTLGTFCARQLSPRNLLIRARPRGANDVFQ